MANRNASSAIPGCRTIPGTDSVTGLKTSCRPLKRTGSWDGGSRRMAFPRSISSWIWKRNSISRIWSWSSKRSDRLPCSSKDRATSGRRGKSTATLPRIARNRFQKFRPDPLKISKMSSVNRNILTWLHLPRERLVWCLLVSNIIVAYVYAPVTSDIPAGQPLKSPVDTDLSSFESLILLAHKLLTERSNFTVKIFRQWLFWLTNFEWNN